MHVALFMITVCVFAVFFKSQNQYLAPLLVSLMGFKLHPHCSRQCEQDECFLCEVVVSCEVRALQQAH